MLITIATLIADPNDAVHMLNNQLESVEHLNSATQAGILKYAAASLMIDPDGIPGLTPDAGGMWAVVSVVLPDVSLANAAGFVNKLFKLPVHESQFVEQSNESVVGTALVLSCGDADCEDCAKRAKFTQRRFVALVVFPKKDSPRDLQLTATSVADSFARAERGYVMTRIAEAFSETTEEEKQQGMFESVTVVRVSDGQVVELNKAQADSGVEAKQGTQEPSKASADASKGVLKNAKVSARKHFN
jgi:hypothetical protein